MKYTKEELKEMALTFLWHDGNGDKEANMLLLEVCAKTRLNFEQIRYRIRELARG